MKIKDRLLLKTEDFTPYFKGWRIDGIFNPGAIRDKDEKIELFVRVAESFNSGNKLKYPIAIPGKKFSSKIESIDKTEFLRQDGNLILRKDNTYRLSNISHFRRVILDKNGFDVEKINQNPAFYPSKDYEEFGCEDCRIVYCNGEYLMTYTGVSSKNGIGGCIAKSKDLKKWKRLGIVFPHENKDVVLFPKKINGEYIALTRPVGSFNFDNPSIWISYSKDLIYWGKEECLFTPRFKAWDSVRIGAGCPPIKTKKGWLLIYHGLKDKRYSAGAVLLDLKNPKKIVARSPPNKPLFSPSSEFEKAGFVNNVIFPTGIIEDLDKKSVLIYSGAADSCITVKKVLLKDILDSLVRD